jgi:hypothetical protein
MSRQQPRLSLNDWAVLGVIRESERHCFAVAQELGDNNGPLRQVWLVPQPLVYRSIDHLLLLCYLEPFVRKREIKVPDER